MVKQTWKRSYCQNCSKNVPHWRRKADGFQETVLGWLERIQLGRWHCMHCQCTRYLLPLVDEDADDYRVVDPTDPLDPSKPAIWSLSNSASDDPDAGASDSMVDDLDPQFVDGAAFESAAFESAEPNSSLDTRDMESDESFAGRQEHGFGDDSAGDLPGQEVKAGMILDADVDFSHDGNTKPANVFPLAGDFGHPVSTENKFSAGDEIPELIEVLEAEPAGNFIKDQSLAAAATRMLRFSEKYRDALVGRVLSGNATISVLIEDGKYTESELVSWIADKAKRDGGEMETIELSLLPKKE